MVDQLPIINEVRGLNATIPTSTSLVGRALIAIQCKETSIVQSDVDAQNKLDNIDRIPIPLGVEGPNGLMITVFTKGTEIPCKAS